MPHRFTLNFSCTILDRPNGSVLLHLNAGEVLEVVDWKKPFVKLANGAGFVEDPDFDGHRTVEDRLPRWAPRTSGTAFCLQPSELPGASSMGFTGTKEGPSGPRVRLNPVNMSEKELKSEVKLNWDRSDY